MLRLLITATDQGDVLSVQSDFNDTATYVEMLKQASDLDHITAQPFPTVAPDDILIHLDSKGNVIHVEADRADPTLTILSLLDAATFLITHQHNETTQ